MDAAMSKTKSAAVGYEPPRATATPFPRLAYGIDDAANALDLSRSRIYELIAQGEIGACKVGKRTIIAAAELTAFLERHRVARLAGPTVPPQPRFEPTSSPQRRNKQRPAED
jgi:excisionase family DNA binding protein